VTGTLPAAFREPEAAHRIALIADSFLRLLHRPLIAPGDDPVGALWASPQAILAHGTEPDPLFFFGNAAALAAFGYAAEAFVGLPSRLSAEAPLREEREALLGRVSKNGFITDYAGMRIDAAGKRFRIEQAIVWNLVDAAGVLRGQAATFAR
jgi:hypothetical protein